MDYFTSSSAAEPASLGSELRARFILFVLFAAGFLAFVLSPWLQAKLGLANLDIWFLDSHAILAACDAVRAGLDPSEANPLDVFHRRHCYSDWWFGLGQLGLGRDQNFIVGGSWVLSFLLVAWLTLRPRCTLEAVWFALLMLSPPVLLALARANNDLVIFTFLGLSSVALRAPTGMRIGLAVALIAAATGLKFYPFVAVYLFLFLRPVSRILYVGGAAVLVAGAALYNVWPTLERARFPIPPSLHTVGSPILFGDFGWNGPTASIAGILVIVAAAIGFVRWGQTTGLAEPVQPGGRQLLFALGTVLLVVCFLAGTSYAYRWIFGLWLAPWLWDEAHAMNPSPTRRATARLAGVLLLALLWADGLFCFVVNNTIGAMADQQRLQLQRIWRLLTQPAVWLLMALLAGWLLDAAVATWRAIRATRSKRCTSAASG